MYNKICEYMSNNKMLKKGDRVVVGVSGGADSVCLLYMLGKLRKTGEIKLIAVHVNHGIRGKEALRDEQFVRQLCSNWEIEFKCFSYDVKKLAKEEGLSEEEAGRKVRYQAFLEVCRQNSCNKIAVAHNINDNAETFLFHLFRGTGIKGLSGIEPNRIIRTDFGEITIIRPLLCMERKEIEELLAKEGIEFQTDSTNLKEDYSRNKIRNKILTYAVTDLNAQAIHNINETAAKLREVMEYIDHEAELRYQGLVRQEGSVYLVGVTDLLQEPAVLQKEMIRRILKNLTGNLKDLESKHIEDILALCGRQVGRQIHLPYGIIAERAYEDLKIYIKSDKKWESLSLEPMKPISLPIPGRVFLPELGRYLEASLVNHEKSEPIPKSSCVKWFDYDKIENVVEIRTRKEGDYLQINALGGNKKLKDYFIDRKIPKKERDNQVLITDGSHVIWIPGAGERISEKYKVEDTTKTILLMKLCDMEEKQDDR